MVHSIMARKQLAIQVVCALLCSEKQKKKKKRIWRREYLQRRRQTGPTVPPREIDDKADNAGFMDLLWMSEEEFEFLLAMVEPLITKQHTKMRRAISAKDRLYVTLQFLATGEKFSFLSLQYRIGASTISQIVMETCAALYQVMKKDFMKTPSTEAEWRTVARDFETKWQFPHCLGALGAKRISIQPQASSKGRCSVAVIAAVDANYKFIYTSVDPRGRVPETGLFTDSDLCRSMDRGLLNCPPPEPLPNSDITMPYVFVGDEAYPLRPDVMKPYAHAQMDYNQRILNYRLSRVQRAAENAFGILTNRLRLFRNTILLEPDKVVKITLASLCIHNFLCECKSVAYIPQAFADWENGDHSIIDGAWRKQGTGSFHPVEQRRVCSASDAAKVQQKLLCDYFVSPAGCVPWQDKHI